MLALTVIQGPDKGKRFELPDGQPQLLGRSSEALPLTDHTVSRRHAELTPDDGVWWLRDLASQNGTYLNGLPVTERISLRAGDQIRVGSTLFVFGQAEAGDAELIRLARPGQIETDIEHALPVHEPGNEDSVVLAEPEPRAAAIDHLRVIYRLTAMTSQAPDRDLLLRRVLDLVFTEFKPERGFIMLRAEGEGWSVRPAVVRHARPPADAEDGKIHVSRTILQHTMQKGEGVLSSNAMSDPRFEAGDSVQRMHIRSAICSPIRYRERVYGAVYIDSSIANYTFTKAQLALMNAIGHHTGLAMANTDLYQQKLHAERLAAVGETVASLSHSIKNILQGLRGGADVLEMGLRREDLKIANGGWEILRRNLDRIAGLSMNMLTFSRQRAVEPELTRLETLIAECAELLEGACERKGVALIIDADPEMPPIPMDPNLMHQALINLIGNAVEAVEPERGAVTVRTTYRVTDPLLGSTPALAELEVIDNGPGIPEDRRAWVFEPFRTTKGTKGTGLGLAVTRRIVEEHRGTLALECPPGGGSVFRITLPVEGEDDDPSATTDNTPEERDAYR